MPKKGKKSLNSRQRKLVQTLAKGATITDAAKAAGYKSKLPRQAGSQALKTIANSGVGSDFLDRMGLTDEVLYEKYIYPLLNATEVKFFQREGNVTEKRIVADNTTRRYMVDIVCRIKGLYKSEAEAPITGVKVILVDRGTRPPRMPAIDIPTLSPEELLADGNSTDK